MGNLGVDMNDEQLLAASLCFKCSKLMVRLIVPMNPDDFGITEEQLDEMGVNEEDEVQILMMTCLETKENMNFTVDSCTAYCDKTAPKNGSLFINDPMLL